MLWALYLISSIQYIWEIESSTRNEESLVNSRGWLFKRDLMCQVFLAHGLSNLLYWFRKISIRVWRAGAKFLIGCQPVRRASASELVHPHFWGSVGSPSDSRRREIFEVS